MEHPAAHHEVVQITFIASVVTFKRDVTQQ